MIYIVNAYFLKLESINDSIIKETPNFFVLESMGKRQKITEWDCFFKEESDAKKFLISKIHTRISVLKTTGAPQELIENAEKKLRVFENG
jgi:hypothetical protein